MPAVRVTEACRVHYNYGLHPLAEGEEIPAGEFADHLLATGAPVVEVESGPAADTDGDGVPDGSIAQVLDWVGSDLDKAALARAAESLKETPRKGLLDALEKLSPTTPAPADPAPAV
jgi:hypothetical protein